MYITVTMGMEIAMASGRFLQLTQINSRGKQKSETRHRFRAPHESPGQEPIDSMGEGKDEDWGEVGVFIT